MDEDPLFVPPDWTVLVVEVFFWCSFVLFPLLFAANRGGAYQFQSLSEGFLVSVFIVALITCPLYAALHLAVYLWPRAARIDAFIRGQSVAEFAWPPYYTDLSTKSVIGPPLEKGGEAERMERKANFDSGLDSVTVYYTHIPRLLCYSLGDPSFPFSRSARQVYHEGGGAVEQDMESSLSEQLGSRT